MVGGDKEDLGFLNSSSSGMNTNPGFKASNGANTYFPSAWDPIASLNQNENFEASSVVSGNEFHNSIFPAMMESQGMNSSLVQYPSASASYAELPHKLPCFGSGNFTEMVGSFGLNGSVTQDLHRNPEREMAVSPDGKKRKRTQASDSPYESHKNAEETQQKDHSQETSDAVKEQSDNETKTDQKASKQTGKQTAENSNGGEAPKENYIHVRARRGQATNSHSLAERLRREKISERMRLLQELVPGCNKITGKAVMLDEIINYVQSLQQQVEFLSMKLATVNPELNIDIDQVLSKDVLHLRGGVSAINGLGPGLSTYPSQLGNFHGSLQGIPTMVPQFTPLPQAVLDHDYQSLFQMGFNATSAIDSLGPNDRMKPDV